MPDEKKPFKDLFLNSFFNFSSDQNGSSSSSNSSNFREIISSLAALAGKGKDEMIQMISREIGMSVAAFLKEPLTEILGKRKIRISIEFVSDQDSKAMTKKKAAPLRSEKSTKPRKKTRT